MSEAACTTGPELIDVSAWEALYERGMLLRLPVRHVAAVKHPFQWLK
jgi:hypothetical protein